MWRLNRPSIDEIEEQLDAALGTFAVGDPHAPTTAQKQQLFKLYQRYEETLGRPAQELKGADLPAEFQALVQRGYRQVSDRGRLAKLRADLKIAANECPYCGFGQIEDLDHHLQKAIYKLFSIFPLNLIPACATCNRRKPKAEVTDPTRYWINVYLEDVTADEFFIAVANLTADGALLLEFSIQQAGGVEGELLQRLQNQFKLLDLQNRLRAQLNIHLAGLEVSFRDSFKAQGAAGVASFLSRSAVAIDNTFGRNDWRAAALRALAACPPFCDGGFIKALGFEA